MLVPPGVQADPVAESTLFSFISKYLYLRILLRVSMTGLSHCNGGNFKMEARKEKVPQPQ